MLLRKLQSKIEALIKLEIEKAEISTKRLFYADSYKNKYYSEEIVNAIDKRYLVLTNKITKLREELFE